MRRNAVADSEEGLRHEDIVARHFKRNVRSKWRGAGLGVAQMRVKPRKRLARADNAQIDGAAIGRAKIILRRLHQFASQPGTLPPGLHAEQPKITAFSSQFHVHASREAVRVFRNKKSPFFQVSRYAQRIDALAFEERALHDKRRIDEPRERFNIGGTGKTNRDAFLFWARAC